MNMHFTAATRLDSETDIPERIMLEIGLQGSNGVNYHLLEGEGRFFTTVPSSVARVIEHEKSFEKFPEELHQKISDFAKKITEDTISVSIDGSSVPLTGNWNVTVTRLAN